ncbi:ubiquitin-protein ligase RKR1 [Trametes versicolor FP-101664 SS1]|uniref:ubiquitin-protein ligase RKR1 n=1 Tax=Trametes versicolor (strain FP-101664) TaxID=717944 RepID=UPI0004622EE1|nr:ubiquitin-protein ligase RKR1 [Trametes versicolor FP-101664 SS1]EIW55564.1 hypothetical protein TRAVEDRAFT_129694 [Trametes versicolor FP-101664 SS1]
MPPSKAKSSASSGTRKKHARRAATAHGAPEEPLEHKDKRPKGKDKKNKKEPRKKVYIPPVKPAPVQPNPLDTLGLAQKLPPELLVVLRLLSKKDATTKRRALEELQSAWVSKAQRGGEHEYLVYTLQDTVPVWLHHLPTLFLHPSRRLRLLAIGLHTSILQIADLRKETFFQIREVATSDHAESILGSWCLAAHDVDRQVSSHARESWSRYVTTSGPSEDKLVLDEALFPRVWDFVQRTLLDPGGVYLYLNPPATAAPTPTPSRRGSGRGTPVRRDDEALLRPKSEEDEEDELDRKARLRVGAFGATKWVLSGEKEKASEGTPAIEDFLAPLANPALWSSLYHGTMPPFADTDSYGFGQPVVRRSAWSLLQTLLQRCKGHLDPLLNVLSSAVLRSAWVEPDTIVRAAMWQPLLMFLKDYPNAWVLEAEAEKDEDDEGSASGESDDEDAPKAPPPPKPVANGPAGPSRAYTEFLQFLATGCSGSPAQGYPTVLVILSTIPPSILTSSPHPLEDLFTSFWAAVDARVLNSLDRVAASAAFLSSVSESLTFFVRRLLNAPTEVVASLLRGDDQAQAADVDSLLKAFLRDQIVRTWEEVSSGRLKVRGKDAGDCLAGTFSSLHKISPDLFTETWDVLAGAVQKSIAADGDAISALVPEVLQQLSQQLEPGTPPGDSARALVVQVVRSALDQCSALLETEDGKRERVVSLVGILDAFGEHVFTDPEVAKRVDDLVHHQMHRLLTTIPSLLLLYLKYRQDEAVCSAVWHQVLETVARYPEDVESTLPVLLDAAEHNLLPTYLHSEGELDEAAGSLLTDLLSGSTSAAHTSLARRLLGSSNLFISQDCRENLLRSLADSFILHFDTVLHDEHASLHALAAPLELVRSLSERPEGVASLEAVSSSLLPYLFLYAFLLPQFASVQPVQQGVAAALWKTGIDAASAEVKTGAIAVIKQLLRELLVDCTAKPTPQQILQTLCESSVYSEINVITDIFPSQEELLVMLDDLPSTPLDPSLGAVDPLVPPSTLYRSAGPSPSTYDSAGFNKYARVVNGLLTHLVDDRQMSKENVWALRHLFALAIYAEELKHLPSSESPVFARSVSRAVLQGILDRVQQVATYLLSSTAEENWHTHVTNVLLLHASSSLPDGATQLVIDLVTRARRQDNVRTSRILHMILQHAFRNATKADAELWMGAVRQTEKLAPHTALAIVFSVTRYAPEPPRLDRYRNERAAGALGIPASKANSEGLWLLRNLAAAAPDPESDVIFLPQLRAVNLIKACQQWITSDEDLDEEVQSEMTLLFAHLAPILQGVPGAHWDLIFDVVENNLEDASLDDPSTLVTLSRTLRLFIIIEDLVSTNKALRAIWEERRAANLTLIRDLVSTKLEIEAVSTPLSVCRELALQIVQDLPSSLLTRETLPKMCHLVTDGSSSVQRMAYQLLHEAAKKYTETLVIEAAVDTEGAMTAELPMELLDILQRSLNLEDAEDHNEEWSGYLLAWMVALDLFTDASLKVKSGYIDQIRDLDLVAAKLLPTLFSLLDLYGGIAKAFKLDIWDIDEFYLDYYTSDSTISLRLLAAHVYYRTLLLLPSLIRTWLTDCRDRQLSTAVASYTSKHFSPAIIRTELARVKDPNVATELSGENVTIKVASAVNEVTAGFSVDEQQLELTVKLPVDWPLHTIEVKDAKHVGVTDDRWRAWELGVQQILTFRSGSIVDGLSFFLKNVTSHFEGVAECAICYSVVNATDGSLPRKPCKTCKNRFHAACLYKWFNTSHSSSCPLCRSEIMTGR